MVAPIYFPVFNPNFWAYNKDLTIEEYYPTLNDWIEKYTNSADYEENSKWLYVRVGIAVLKFFAKIGILIEIEINHIVWKYIDRKTWHHIHDICEKLVKKIWEYRYGNIDELFFGNDNTADSRNIGRRWITDASYNDGTAPAA